MSELRCVIREMLKQELAGINFDAVSKNAEEEYVSITNNAELADFIARILKLSEDKEFKNKLLAGEMVFKLDNGTVDNPSETRASTHQDPIQSSTLNISKGLITEKQVKTFPDDLAVVTIGKSVCLTPLASDEIRRRRIKIERSTS